MEKHCFMTGKLRKSLISMVHGLQLAMFNDTGGYPRTAFFFLRDGHGREKTRDENDEGRGRILTFDGSSISTILPC